MDAWAAELGCSREALARALAKQAGGSWKLERLLRALPGDESGPA